MHWKLNLVRLVSLLYIACADCFQICNSYTKIGKVELLRRGCMFQNLPQQRFISRERRMCKNVWDGIRLSAGQGFQKTKSRLRLEYGGSPGDPEVQRMKWESQYKSYISEMGKYITGMSWKGYMEVGKGAIQANNQLKPNPKVTGKGRSSRPLDQAPSTKYVPITYFESKLAEDNEHKDSTNINQIIARLDNYDPNREFVVVFEAAGLMGVDVVRPSIPPPEMHCMMTDEVILPIFAYSLSKHFSFKCSS